jgi:excisionase family DNA binding protein
MIEQLLRSEEVASRLNISLATAYRWMRLGVLPVVRLPGIRSIRVPNVALERWIRRNTRESAAQTNRSRKGKGEIYPQGRRSR